MVSNCMSATMRELFVAELQTFVNVDIYGRCGSLSCDRTNGYDPGNFKKYL
jgi:alpha-1,3-fucosyltransferase